MRVFITIDPAFTKNVHSDQTSIMVWWFVGDNHYILEYRAWKRDINELMQEAVGMIGKHKPEKVWIETVGGQLVLKTTLEDLLQKNKIYTIVEWINTKSNKETKIRSLLVKYANWLIRHRVEHLELEKQLLEFPKWAHDDIVDSLAMQYEIHRPTEETNNIGMWLQTSTDYYWNTIYH
jgi:predicted phage terminase large subunit-like protein